MDARTPTSVLAELLRSDHASLLPPPPVRRPDVEAALDAARERLGVAQAARRRDGMPREQFAFDVR